MNPIEYFWAWVKRWFRERSNGTWQKPRILLTKDFASVPSPPSAASIDVWIAMQACIVWAPPDQLLSLLSSSFGPIVEFVQQSWLQQQQSGKRGQMRCLEG